MPAANDSFWERNKERILTSLVLLSLAYSVIRNILKAATKPFWFDELCTWIVARQPNLSSLWRSLARAADGQPPPYYVLERVFDRLIPNDHIAFRLSSILAFCLMQWCLFVWLRRRHDIVVAFFASLIPMVTALYGTYAVEARPYCLVVGCLGVALVAYQHVPSPGWTLVFGLSLFAAQALHYYSVFMMSPFFAAEAVFWLKTKSFRWPVWTALFAGFLPVIPFWPILSHFRSYYSGHYWSHANILASLRTYGWVLGIVQGSPKVFSWPLVAGLLLTTVALAASVFFLIQSLRANSNLSANFHEQAMIAGFLSLPVILYAATKLGDGGFTPRYLLPVALGMVLAAARGLAYLSRKSLVLVGGLLCFSIAVQEAGFWISYYGSYQLGFAFSKPVEQLAGKVGHTDLPVVVSDGHDYIESDHYATPQWKERLTFIADPVAAVAYGRADTTEKEVIILDEFAKLRVFRFDEFVSLHRQFLLYSNPAPENSPDWWTARLPADGYSLKNLATEGGKTVYLVEPKHAE